MTLELIARPATTLTPTVASSTTATLEGRRLDRTSWGMLLALVVVAIGAYRQSFVAPFTLDDFHALFQVPAIRSPLTAWSGVPSRRFVFLTFSLNYYFGGYQLFWYHAVNLAIHVTAGLTLFGLARRTFRLPGMRDELRQRSSALAGAIALLWLVHPLQTQAVTYIVQRFESAMGLMFLMSMYGLVRGATAARGWPWYGLSLLAGWLGLESKESMVVLPFVALAYDRTFLATSWRQLFHRRWWVHLGLAILAAGLIVNSRGALDTSQAASAGFGATSSTPWQYLCSQAGVIVHYLRLTVWPDVLCIDYRWPIAESWPAIVAPGLVIVTLLGLSGWGLWRAPRLGFLGLTFFLLLAVTSSIIPIDDLAVEHRMYLPLTCVLSLLVLAVDALIARALREATARRLARGALLGVVVAALALRTSERNRDYVDPIRLWAKAIVVNPRNDRAYTYVGRSLREAGRFEEAETHLMKAMEINPDSAMARAHLGMLKSDQGQADEAVRLYEAALELRPAFVKVMILLGNLHARAHRYDEAIELYRRATSRQSTNAEAWRQLGSAAIATGDANEAVASLRTAIQLQPHDDMAAGRLAWVLATASSPTLRDEREALEIAERLAKKTARRDYGILQILAAAQANAGRYAEAESMAEVALALAELAEDQLSQDLLKSHLARYRAGRNVDLTMLFPDKADQN